MERGHAATRPARLRRGIVGGSGSNTNPLSLATRTDRRCSLAGIRPEFFQLLTAAIVTPKIFAAFAVPPRASIKEGVSMMRAIIHIA